MGLYAVCANDKLYRRLVTEVLGRPTSLPILEFAHRKARTANKEKLRAIIAGVFASDRLENWMAKMKRPTFRLAARAPSSEVQRTGSARSPSPPAEIPHPTARSPTLKRRSV